MADTKSFINKLNRYVDSRGMVLEVFRGDQVDFSTSGQVYLTTVNPGKNKGNHFHKRKDEWFAPLQGKALLVLSKIDSDEKMVVELDSEDPSLIRVETGIAHKIINNSNEVFYLLAFISEIYNPEDSDTYLYDPDEDNEEGR